MTKHSNETHDRGGRGRPLFRVAWLGLAAASALTMITTSADRSHAEETPQWQSILALQLRDSHRCELDKVLFVHDVPAGSSVATEGRARCLDGREFDFSRDREHEKFTLRLCQPTVC